MNTFISMTNIQKQVDDFSLGPVTITIEPGTITAFVGDNGSGKSTILKMMMNLVHADTGTIHAFGLPVDGDDETWKQRIAYQPQTTVGYDAFTGNHLREFISHWYPLWDEKLFHEMIGELQIPLDKRFSKLSQGVQQKLTLALTIARGASLLILDEPSTFIDIPAKKYITELLVDWIDAGERSIILASHQAEDIKKLADYLVLLRGGEFLGQLEKDELVERYQRYWINSWDNLPPVIPGELARESYSFLSGNRKKTEMFLQANGVMWEKNVAVDLEEIIAHILQR